MFEKLMYKILKLCTCHSDCTSDCNKKKKHHHKKIKDSVHAVFEPADSK